MSKRFVIASNNADKTAELISIFASFGRQAISYQDLIERVVFPTEGTNSYLENAMKKARFIADKLPDEWVVADDSGMRLVAYPDQLGVVTARQLADYTETMTMLNEHIIRMVNGKEHEVTMTSHLVLITPEFTLTSEGSFEGMIADKEAGHNGRSFDLILRPKGSDKTLAELPDAERIPQLHRTKAVKQLLSELEEKDGKN